MHIPDGFVSGSVNAACGAAALSVCALALARANRTLGDKQVPLLGVTSAFIVAAQMVNFPVACGTSGHFLGALLAAIPRTDRRTVPVFFGVAHPFRKCRTKSSTAQRLPSTR